MKSKLTHTWAFILCLLGSGGAQAATWTLGQWYQYSGTGNYYSVQAITGVSNGWLIANGQATSLTGPGSRSVTLASVTSANLDAFIFAGIDDPTYWSTDVANNDEGPNIGGHQFDKQAEPAGHWAWSNGDTWNYTQWAAGEPNNSSGVEDYTTLFCNTGATCRSGNWNDISSGVSPVGTAGSIHYYIAEASGPAVSGVPEPSTWAMMLLGFAGLGFAGYRSSRKSSAATA
jgi:hypothetical protein